MSQTSTHNIEQQAEFQLLRQLSQLAELTEQRDAVLKSVGETRAIIQGIKIGREAAAQDAAQEAPSA